MIEYVRWAREAGLPADPRQLIGLPLDVDRFVMPILRLSQERSLLPTESFRAYVSGFNVTEGGLCLFVDGEGDVGEVLPYLAFDGGTWSWVERYESDTGDVWMRGYPCRVRPDLAMIRLLASPPSPPAPAKAAYEEGPVPRLTPRFGPYLFAAFTLLAFLGLYLYR